MLEYAVNYAFAGLWGIIWHLGIALTVAILAGLAAWFSPVGKTLFAAICAASLAFVVGEAEGIKLQRIRNDAQAQVIQTDVDKVVTHTKTPKARKSKDKWDSPKN